MASPNRPPQVQALLDLITHSVDAIADAYAKKGVPFPDLNDAVTPFAPHVAMTPELMGAKTVIIGACTQLSALVDPPAMAAIRETFSLHYPTAVRIAIEAHVPELLSTVGPEGMHIDEIGKQTGYEPRKLSRILRLLTTHHFFTEVKPDTFANNRLSVALSTRKDFKVLKSQEEADWYTDSDGVAALLAHTTADVYQLSAYLPELLRSPTLGQVSRVEDCMKVAFNFDGGMWEWFHSPENKARLARFTAGMVGTERFGRGDEVLDAYDWDAIPAGSTIVDLGGNVGQQCLTIRNKNAGLKFVVQDLPGIVGAAEKFWESNDAEALKNGDVTIIGKSFLEEVVPKNAAVYFFRHVLHDWPAQDVVKILKKVKEAMTSTSTKSKLVILDRILKYSAPDATLPPSSIYQPPSAPPPLLSNFGGGLAFPYTLDLGMMNLNNGEERTISAWTALIEQSGFKIEALRGDLLGISVSSIICVPV
ncbi:S-adenosyl-L-methionine-dependent methyltransferase [Atractiella rhizophila]|nr:S-adenosyl-L-methionine-dependent methyltransferase [Atractiella rhizophila]